MKKIRLRHTKRVNGLLAVLLVGSLTFTNSLGYAGVVSTDKLAPRSAVHNETVRVVFEYGRSRYPYEISVIVRDFEKAVSEVCDDIVDGLYTFGASRVGILTDNRNLFDSIKERFEIPWDATYSTLLSDETLKTNPNRSLMLTNAYLKELYGRFEIVRIAQNVWDEVSRQDMVSQQVQPGMVSADSILNGVRTATYIGVDIGMAGIKIGIPLADGRFFEKRYPWQSAQFTSSAEHRVHIENAILDALAQTGLAEGEINGIGICIPAAVWGERIAPARFISGITSEQERRDFLQDLSTMIQGRFGVRPVFGNDGNIAAFYMALTANRRNALCLSLGGGLGAGYVDRQGMATDMLNEMGKLSIDRAAGALEHQEVGIKGAATRYVTQKGVFEFALSRNILTPQQKEVFRAIGEDAQKSMYLRHLMSGGHQGVSVATLTDEEKAVYEKISAPDMKAQYIAILQNGGNINVSAIFSIVGEYLGEFIARAYQYLKMEEVIIFGGVASRGRGEIIMAKAGEVLQERYPRIFGDVTITLSEEAEFGQAHGAAYYACQNAILTAQQRTVTTTSGGEGGVTAPDDGDGGVTASEVEGAVKGEEATQNSL